VKQSKGYRKYSTVSKYLRKEFNLGSWVTSTGPVTIAEKEDIKDLLCVKHTAREIRTLRAGITAQYETYKIVTIIFGIITFFLSATIGVVSTYASQTLKVTEWVNEARTTIAKEELAQLSQTEKIEYINNSLNRMISEYMKLNDKIIDNLGISIVVMSVPIIIGAILYIQRFRWIASLNSIVCEAYEDKKELNNYS